MDSFSVLAEKLTPFLIHQLIAVDTLVFAGLNLTCVCRQN